jgi:protein-disulfide isomerase
MSKKAGRESAAARAAAVRAEQERAERRRNILIVVGVVVVVAVIVGVGFFVQSSRDTTGEADNAPSGPVPTATAGDAAVAAADKYGLGVGNPDAKVKVEIFEDFLCPFCDQYEKAGRDQLRQDVADGKAYLVYRPLAFLNEYSARSLNAFAVVLNTAGPEAALKFHDLLYDNQPSETGKMPDNNWLIDNAVQAGATKAEVTDGINMDQYKQWVVNGADDASKRRVTQTPTVFVNGTAITGATSIEDLLARTQQQIDDGQ